MRPFGAAFFDSLEVSMVRGASDSRQRGHTLPEVLVVIAVTAVLTTLTVRFFEDLAAAAELTALTGRLSGLMYRCRGSAMVQGRAVSLVFERRVGDDWRCFIAEDGDGDGVRRSDIRTGRDRIVSEVLQLEGQRAGLGILSGVRVPNPSGRGYLRGNLDDPVRAGRGDIITFTPRSTATPSSVYLTDRKWRMRVLRVYGGTARVHSLFWRRGWGEWRRGGL
jgi:prepilin-type N-terminal cleavage/methylation domain-containing protein